MISEKGILAKLLAKENLTIQHGNYHTAWFDIKNRTLGLPLWKDMGKDVYDLLIGHEVGHALFTPFEGWHDSPEKLEGCPRSYINVIEDARIERKIRDQYAGLVGPMARGYRKLLEEEFFGPVERDDWEEVKLIDKINLKTKLQSLIDVPFSPEEKVFLDRSLKTETFSEVIQLVKDIYAWTKENQEELLSPPPPQGKEERKEEIPGEQEEMPQMGHDDSLEENTKEQEEETQENQFEVDESTEETDSQDQLHQEMESKDEIENANPEDYERSETDDNFRDSERRLIEEDEFGIQPVIARAFSREVANQTIVPYERIAKERLSRIKRFDRSSYYNSLRDEFTEYMKESKSSVYYAVKEFEQRKAAFRWTRAQTAKTGSIDVNKLWSYKTNEDIFSKVTRLADAKNHGMMMLIDYSGSMSDVMGGVLDQTIMLALFCKAVNIPFDVYAFTCRGYDSKNKITGLRDGDLFHGELNLVQITSSQLNKADFNESLYHMFVRKQISKMEGYESRWMEQEILGASEDYGSTPLNEALIVCDYLIKDFKRKNQVEKMNLVIISDGDSNSSRVYTDFDLKVERAKTSQYYGSDSTLIIGGTRVKLQLGRHGTPEILDYLSKKYDMNNVGFFISEKNWHFKDKLEKAYRLTCKGEQSYRAEDEYVKNAQKEYMKNKCVAINDVFGYNEFYLLKKVRKMDTETDAFDPSSNASKGQITSAFKKYSKSKSLNKVLLTKFGKVVA